jgi:hypothetical protein
LLERLGGLDEAAGLRFGLVDHAWNIAPARRGRIEFGGTLTNPLLMPPECGIEAPFIPLPGQNSAIPLMD